jgi:hypothetical protein
VLPVVRLLLAGSASQPPNFLKVTRAKAVRVSKTVTFSASAWRRGERARGVPDADGRYCPRGAIDARSTHPGAGKVYSSHTIGPPESGYTFHRRQSPSGSESTRKDSSQSRRGRLPPWGLFERSPPLSEVGRSLPLRDLNAPLLSRRLNAPLLARRWGIGLGGLLVGV